MNYLKEIPIQLQNLLTIFVFVIGLVIHYYSVINKMTREFDHRLTKLETSHKLITEKLTKEVAILFQKVDNLNTTLGDNRVFRT